MNVNERIERMLIMYLKVEKGIDAVSASFGDTCGPYDDGCDTCDCSTERSFEFEIIYTTSGTQFSTCINVPGDPLYFFPTLLEYDIEV